MNISLDNDATGLIFKYNGTEALMNLLEDANEVCVLNVTKAIANIAKLLAAREVLLACAPRLKEISESSQSKSLAQQALIAHGAVTWEP